MSKHTTISIIPPEAGDSGAVLTQGTRIVTEDGQEIKGVTKVVLTAEVDNLWRAHIEVWPRMVSMNGMLATWEPTPQLSWWRRILMRFRRKDIEVAQLRSSAGEWRIP